MAASRTTQEMTEMSSPHSPRIDKKSSHMPKDGHVALLVIGMHRSGTSATTGAIQRLGVPLGPKLYRGHKGINAKGYFEHADIADTNDEILLNLGSSWDDICLHAPDWSTSEIIEHRKARLQRFVERDFGTDSLWALKDPRIARLLPLWKTVLKDCGVTPVYLFSLRAPGNVSRSLEKRDGFSRDKSMLLWILHYLEAERESRGQPRTFVDYDVFLEDPISELKRVEDRLGIAFPLKPNDHKDLLNDFLSKDLRSHKSKAIESNSEIESLAFELYGVLRQAATDHGEPDPEAIEAIDHRVQAIYARFPSVLTEHMQTCSRRNGEVQLVLNKILRSWSWVTGKPVRFLERLLGRDV